MVLATFIARLHCKEPIIRQQAKTACLQTSRWQCLGRACSSNSRPHSVNKVEYALLDIDGVLVSGDKAIPGSVEASQNLRKHVRALRFVTNNSRAPRANLVENLRSMGFDLEQDQVFSALSAARHLVDQEQLRPLCLLTDDALAEFQGVPSHPPNAVILGTAPEHFHYERLTEAARVLLSDEGTKLIAVNKGRYFKSDDGLALMAGPFVAALEFATGRKASVVGKPRLEFFHAAATHAAASVGRPTHLENCVMIGDDVFDDVQGAMDAGMQAILVRTGKYQLGDEARLRSPALAVVDDLAGALAFLRESRLLEEGEECGKSAF